MEHSQWKHNFGRRWAELAQLSERNVRRGFDGDRRLIKAQHEIRGLACHPLEDGHYFVVAGDKSGHWYAAEFDFGEAEGTASAFVQLDPPPPPDDGKHRVIDDVLIAPWAAEGYGIVLATRGGGAWIASLAQVRERLRKGDDGAADLMPLPESKGRRVQGLVYDAASETLLAVAQHEHNHELLVWSLKSWDLQVTREDFPCAISCLAIDKAATGTGEDLLYVATSRYELYSFERSQPEAPFRVTAEGLASKDQRKEWIWQGRISPILRMRPLSDVGYRDLDGNWQRTFPKQRGVLAMTLRHLLLIYDMPGEPARCHARLVVGEAKNLDITILNFPEKVEAGKKPVDWHGVAVSTLESKIRIFRPSGIRRPESGGFGLFRRDTPENGFPTLLISGYKDVTAEVSGDRVYAMEALLPPGGSGSEIGVIFGLGDHEVRWHRFKLRWRLREQARAVAQQLVQEAPSIDLVLDNLEEIALSSVYWRPEGRELVRFDDALDPRYDKHTLVEVLPRLWRRCETDEHWHRFYLLVWDVLARRTPRYVAVSMIQTLRRAQLKFSEEFEGSELLRRYAELEEHITKIRKFVLDPGHFSKKRTHFLELASSQDPDLQDECAVYRSILIARRHDPIFVTDFDPIETGLIGEVLTLTPLPAKGGGPFWDVPDPSLIRFVATNYSGDLWLLDGEGRARRLLKPSGEPSGSIQAVHVHRDHLWLSYSDGRVQQLAIEQFPNSGRQEQAGGLRPRQIESIGDRRISATAFAEVSSGDGASRLLWGDASGAIYVLGQEEALYAPRGYQAPDKARIPPPGGRAVLQLAFFEAEWPSGEQHPYVLAATARGQLLLFHWREGDSVRLRLASEHQVGSDPISALLITGPQNRHVVVARFGTAVGLALLGQPQAPRLGLIWAFRTGDTVRSIQPVTPGLAKDDRPHRVLVGSHDAHLYALDLEGRHLETFSLRQDPLHGTSDLADRQGFKLGLFVTAPPRLPEDDENVIVRVYACAFENRYLGLRLIDRPRMLREFDDDLGTLEPDERELSLTRWRAYHVEEGHLRHRFVLQSQRYPGQTRDEILKTLDWLLEAGDTSFEPTGEMTALLRRLFQGLAGGSTPDGSDALLSRPELYRQTIKLLRECEQRWDTPNSIANQRLMLFWIRSFLRQIKSPEAWRQWIQVAGEVTDSGEPQARPQALLRRFLEQSDRLVQYKTLQYLERMVFGWPETDHQQPIFQRGEVRSGDLDWLLDALFARLSLRPEQVSRQDPSPVVLQIGRLLCLLIRDGHIDPLYLTYEIQRRSLPLDFYQILEDQLETISGLPEDPGSGEPASDPVSILRDARRLDHSLERGASLPEIVSNLEALIDRPWPQSHGPDRQYLAQAPNYFKTLLPLLRLENLDQFSHLAQGDWQPPPLDDDFGYCPSYSYLADLQPLLEAIRGYFYKKYDDYLSDSPMVHLRFEDFHRVRCEWQRWKKRVWGLLREEPAELAQRENLLIKRLLKQWQEILIEKEQKTALLQDFQEALERHCFEEIEQSYRFDPEKVKQVQEEKALAFTAFGNLFTRLLLFAEPVEGAFLYLWKGEKEGGEVRGRWFRDGLRENPEVVALGAESYPAWFPENWEEPESFSLLEEVFYEKNRTDPDRAWEVQAISGTPDEEGPVAYYVFAWSHPQAPGLVRFKSQQLAWAVPLQALVYRRAAVEQIELKGRVFSIIAHNLGSPVYHMRSDLRVLLDRRLEEASKKSKRFDKYTQLLRQARHMDGIIDSIMSMSDRKIAVQVVEVSIAQLAYDVVRTIRREARARNIQIEYREPGDKLREQTVVRTDEPKVYDILMMVLNNAVKYSPIGGQIFVDLDLKSRGVEVRVTDQGPGIPEEERPHIYEAFFRGSSARDTASGLGLGLYTAKLYTDRLGGYLNHRNHPNGGSIFDLFIPDIDET